MRPTCLDLRDLSIFLLEVRAASAQDVASLNCLDRVSSFLFLFLSSSFIFFFYFKKETRYRGIFEVEVIWQDYWQFWDIFCLFRNIRDFIFWNLSDIWKMFDDGMHFLKERKYNDDRSCGSLIRSLIKSTPARGPEKTGSLRRENRLIARRFFLLFRIIDADNAVTQVHKVGTTNL